MKDTRDDEIEIDLLQLFWVMKRRLWIMILAVVVGAAAANPGGTGLHFFHHDLHIKQDKQYYIAVRSSVGNTADKGL